MPLHGIRNRDRFELLQMTSLHLRSQRRPAASIEWGVKQASVVTDSTSDGLRPGETEIDFFTAGIDREISLHAGRDTQLYGKRGWVFSSVFPRMKSGSSYMNPTCRSPCRSLAECATRSRGGFTFSRSEVRASLNSYVLYVEPVKLTAFRTASARHSQVICPC